MSRTSDAVAARSENFIRFEVRDGIRRVTCNVLDDALEAVSGLTAPSSLMLRRRSFDRFRTLINAAAQMKLQSLPAGSPGPIVLTRMDLRGVPPQSGVPSFGSTPRGSTHPMPRSLAAVAPATAPDAPAAVEAAEETPGAVDLAATVTAPAEG